MFRLAMTLAAATLTIAPFSAAAWETPQRGSDLRTHLMDAMRPHAEWILGAPVSFPVSFDVSVLRVDGDVAFASLHPMRPGGREITAGDIPQRPGWDNPFDWGGTNIQALYQRSGNTWVAVHHATGATDVWWADPQFCPTWGTVIPEVC